MKKLLQLTHSIVNFILNQLTYLPDFRVTSWNNRGYRKSTLPFLIHVKNTTNSPLEFFMFGCNIFLEKDNFGSPKGLEFKSLENVKYSELLKQSASQPFETDLIRVRSTNTKQISQELKLNTLDSNKQFCSVPIDVDGAFSAYQFQSGIVDVPINLVINGDTYLKTTILPNTEASYSFYPKPKETFWQKVIKVSTITYRLFLNLLHVVFAIVVISYLIKKIFLI